MKKILSALFSVFMLMSVCYGYTLKVDDGRGMTTSQVDSGNTVFVGLPGAENSNYVVREGDVTLSDVSGESGMKQFVMPSENVWITLVRPGDVRKLILKNNLGKNETSYREIGSTVEVIAEYIEEYVFQYWTSEGITLTDTSAENLSFTMPIDHVTLTANYVYASKPITATAGANGSISPSGTIEVNWGESQTYTMIPDANYLVSDVVVDGVSVGAVTNYTFTNVKEEHTIHVEFVRPTYTITASAGTGGSISPSGTTTVNRGESKSYTVTANSGYAISGVTVDGTSIGVATKVSLSNITENHTITVNFEQIPDTSLGYNGGSQTYTVPARGIYKLEVWGAGGSNNGGGGGSGGYGCGYAILEKGQKLYVTIGGAGSGTQYNGGGPRGGGGATHIASVSGTLTAIGASNLSKIYIIAGGGGGGGTKTESWGLVRTYTGGSGGGESGSNGGGDPSYGIASGGTQTSGAGFGGATSGSGGGGLYGGVSGGQTGGGGSGYIGGVPSFTYNGTTYSPSWSTGGGAGAHANGSAKISFIMSISDDFNFIAPTPYVCSGGVQTYTAPVAGLYKLEAFGAGGGASGGAGGYSVGYVQLSANQTLYIVVGGSGGSSRYNGGGSPGGGGATHIATVSGTLAQLGNVSNVLLIAGGGGGGATKTESWGLVRTYTGGAGGGSSGTAGDLDPSYTQGVGGTSSTGYAFGQGGDGSGGGGSGLYGGTGGGGAAAGGGGSGYIGGVPAITYGGTTYSPSTTVGGGSSNNSDGKVIISFVG
ncbi:MAG: hypothetical protein J6M02_02745 [Clostridia bacterium]|nr:hypothetical protein [Clostridia bacterium]